MSLSTAIDLAVDLLLVVGGLASLLAAVAIVRLPDVYTRLHGAAKAGTLGVFAVMTAAALGMGSRVVALEASLIVAFLFITAPIASHLVARAALHVGMPMTRRDGDARQSRR